MNPELEALILALDAVSNSRGDDLPSLKAIYESRLDDVLSRFPGMDRARLEASIQKAHQRWVNAQKKHTGLPPSA